MEKISVRDKLRELGIHPSKRRGQNFLTDMNIIRLQVREAELESRDRVLEIGPGLGILTETLLRSGAEVTAVEKDPLLYRYLLENLKPFYDNLTIVHGDFLKTEISNINKVVSNLPYNISSPVTFRLRDIGFKRAVLMYQHEFALRLIAPQGSGEYSRLSVMCQYDYDAFLLKNISRNVFYPRPKVDSALVKLEPKHRENAAKDYHLFRDLVRAAFSNRRKKLRNALTNSDNERLRSSPALKALSNYADRRAEEISVEEFIQMANSIPE